MTRRKRSDSKEAAVEALMKASELPAPPPYIRLADEVLPFWEAIIKTRADWTENDLIIAAELARIEHEIEQYRQTPVHRLDRDPDTGALKPSPLHKILNDLTALQLSLCRQLQIHARATQGESRDQIRRNGNYRAAQAQLKTIDSLIKLPEPRVS